MNDIQVNIYLDPEQRDSPYALLKLTSQRGMLAIEREFDLEQMRELEQLIRQKRYEMEWEAARFIYAELPASRWKFTHLVEKHLADRHGKQARALCGTRPGDNDVWRYVPMLDEAPKPLGYDVCARCYRAWKAQQVKKSEEQADAQESSPSL